MEETKKTVTDLLIEQLNQDPRVREALDVLATAALHAGRVLADVTTEKCSETEVASPEGYRLALALVVPGALEKATARGHQRWVDEQPPIFS